MFNNIYIENLKIDNSEMEQIKKEVNIIAEFVKKNCSKKINIHGKDDINSLYNYYNVFNFKQYLLDSVFIKIKNFFIKSYNPTIKYYISSCINIHKKGEKIKLHNKLPYNNSYHGYFALQLEPSTTFYKCSEQNLICFHKNKNGLILINDNHMGLYHLSKWNEEYERLFISFDIVPFQDIQEHHVYNNCFIPFV